MPTRPNVLFIMTDQQRFDTIAALGNADIVTPNLDRLVRRGATFLHGYSSCPVCVPARYIIRTGCESPKTAVWQNGPPRPVEAQAANMEQRCGAYLPRAMAGLGYRTFGIGKFHTQPKFEDLGYETHLHTEEGFGSPDDRAADAYASFIERQHPEYAHVEQPHGERTDMYYMPQMSPLPKELTVESFVADRAVEQINASDDRPYFGFVSFIGPHPPLAPPVPFNRMYDPDRMPNPIRGDIDVDHMDEQIPWMNHIIWADDISDMQARACRARYYGEITYIDWCLGRLLDAVDAREDADNTLICFFSDHGEHLGDHHAWQKESFFEPSAHVPFLLSWPARIEADQRREELVCLTDLFAIATGAAGQVETRDGIDVLGALAGDAAPRDVLFSLYGEPGGRQFKIMARDERWKYIYLANGGREQLFDLHADPNELTNLAAERRDVADRLRAAAIERLREPNADRALDGDDLKAFEFEARPRRRIYQMAVDRGARGFPDDPAELLRTIQ